MQNITPSMQFSASVCWFPYKLFHVYAKILHFYYIDKKEQINYCSWWRYDVNECLVFHHWQIQLLMNHSFQGTRVSPPSFSGVCVAQSSVFCVVLCQSLYFFISLFCRELKCLACFDWQISDSSLYPWCLIRGSRWWLLVMSICSIISFIFQFLCVHQQIC